MNTQSVKERTRTGGDTKQKYYAFLTSLRTFVPVIKHSEIQEIISCFGISKSTPKHMADLQFLKKEKRGFYRVQNLDNNIDLAVEKLYAHQLQLSRIANRKRTILSKKKDQLASSGFEPTPVVWENTPTATNVHSIDSFIATLSDGTLISALIKRGYIILKDASK